MTHRIAAIYHFTPIAADSLPALRDQLLAEFTALDLRGTLLLATEGINGTLSGTDDAITALLETLHKRFDFPIADAKLSAFGQAPFQRLKVKIKREILTFNEPSADPLRLRGHDVPAKDWNDLIARPDVLILDTRNDYESEAGTFQGAICPPIARFTEFADYVRRELSGQKNRPVAMFCTGGIRCEKASAFMLAEGFSEVHQLKGGILKYLEDIAPEHSLWQGDCFVFDDRRGVGHGLVPASDTP